MVRASDVTKLVKITNYDFQSSSNANRGIYIISPNVMPWLVS